VVNKAITLNTANLINSNASVSSTIDSGIAGIQFTTDPAAADTYSVSITGGNGSGATAAAGTLTDGVSANNNLYVAMTSAGSGYSPANAPTVSITNSGSNPVGGTVTAVVSSVNLTGVANNIGGDGNLTINAVVSGGGFTKVGNGTLTLGGVNTYSSDTNLSQGKLVVAAAGSISGNVNVSANTTLTVNGTVGGNVPSASGAINGTGSINGTVSLTSTGSIQAGTPTSVGTLAVSNMDLSQGGSFKFALDSSTGLISLFTVGGAQGIKLDNSLANLVPNDLYAGVPTQPMIDNLAAIGTFTIAQVTNGVSGGTFSGYAEGGDVWVGYNRFTISYAGGFGTDIVLQYQETIPEPQTWAMFLGGTGLLIGFMRSRRYRK
jgi:autotransporter-associated beta strand protein